MGDRERLHQVIANLLTNALKFTPSGGRIILTCARDATDIVITVADTGEGIAPEFLPLLFDRFSQADASSTRRHGGLGFGLAIVKHLVRLHGGTVTAESSGPGRGATFSVRLPTSFPDDRPGARAERTLIPTMRRLDGVEILLVEDDRDVLEAMTHVLESTGARVRSAASVQEGLSAFEAHTPDILVSDLSMPEEDGYSLLRRIRQHGDRAVPAIALTGFTRPEDKVRVLAAGFVAHVPKPIDPDELVRLLADTVLKQRSVTGR